ncbi:hypothetical protein PV390_09945 [Streptomyces sp. ME02-6991-2A]|uniref:hypothetical protein n=1 Tax=Streptomyces sp. ME02-6991-2A TaxID=3028677 RepID=UPI0029BC6CEC|nr:hypothetical protein [Streptomyces sp. ME02-6991-2A]MDX3374730.1 hypothetical protein [Streptomyces sp. ME02-6991-2A]
MRGRATQALRSRLDSSKAPGMPSLRASRPASPAAGMARGLRAGSLAVLCVSLPLAAHLLARCQAPVWAVVAALTVVAVPAAVVLTRRRLSDNQVVGVLGVSQLAYHLAYALPGVCRAVGADGVPLWTEHAASTHVPSGVLLSGQLVTLLVAARALGLTELLLGRGRPLLAAVGRLLAFVRPSACEPRVHGPRCGHRRRTRRLRSAVLARLRSGRAPPAGVPGPPLVRPMPAGGPCLP